MKRGLLVLVALLAGLPLLAQDFPRYRVAKVWRYDVPYPFFLPNRMNDRGQFVGEMNYSSSVFYACRWSEEEGYREFYGFENRRTWGNNINSLGHLCGSASRAITSFGAYWNDEYRDVGNFSGREDRGSVANALNDLGWVVGTTDDFNTVPFLWRNGTMTNLGRVKNGLSEAIAVNNNDVVLGAEYGSNGSWQLSWT